jgi:hypothetical protein
VIYRTGMNALRHLVTAACLVACLLVGATDASAAVRNLFYGGTCSTNWGDSAQLDDGSSSIDTYGFWAGEETWNVQVRQTASTTEAVADLKARLDSLCTGSNYCYLFTYSQGGAIYSKLASTYASSWNIVEVYVTGNNEGGSELSSADWLAELALGCSYASAVRPTNNRPSTGWNHNDTNGKMVRQFVGDIGAGHLLWYVTSGFLPGDDDGVVAFHSSTGRTTTGSYTDACGGTRWTNHTVNGGGSSCQYSYDHIKIKTQHSCYYGGGACP